MTGGTVAPATLAAPAVQRFLSAHYDDVALSCGGTVATLASLGRTPEIVVIFAAGPAPSGRLTPFAAATQVMWGLPADRVTAGRRREEEHAAAILGAAVRLLPFADAIYRGDRYQDNQQLFGAPVVEEADLPERIASDLHLDPDSKRMTRLYAPLAVGGHVDHQHAFAAGVLLARSGWEVWFYEDLPYALRPGAVAARVADVGCSVEPLGAVAVADAWRVRIAAVLAYRSQLASAFGYVGVPATPAAIKRALAEYLAEAGNGGAGERFWRLQKTHS